MQKIVLQQKYSCLNPVFAELRLKREHRFPFRNFLSGNYDSLPYKLANHNLLTLSFVISVRIIMR